MLRRLTPDSKPDLLSLGNRAQLNLPGMHFLTEKVLSLDQVQRISLTAIGLSQSHAKAEELKAIHIALAGFIMVRSDHAELCWSAFNERKQMQRLKSDMSTAGLKDNSMGESTEASLRYSGALSA